MPNISRRGFLAGTAAVAGTARLVGPVVARRPVLTLVYDKALGMMRAIDRLVP